MPIPPCLVAVVVGFEFPDLVSLLLCHNPPHLSHDSLCPRLKPVQDVKKRKKKGRGGSDAPARGGGGKKAAVTLGKVTRKDKVTPKQAGFTHVRCAFIDAKGERCGEVKEWDQQAVKDLRPGGDGAWVAVVPTHQPSINGKRVHSAAFEPWKKKIGEAVDDGECLVGTEGVKYLSYKNASTMVTANQTAFQEYLASET